MRSARAPRDLSALRACGTDVCSDVLRIARRGASGHRREGRVYSHKIIHSFAILNPRSRIGDDSEPRSRTVASPAARLRRLQRAACRLFAGCAAPAAAPAPLVAASVGWALGAAGDPVWVQARRGARPARRSGSRRGGDPSASPDPGGPTGRRDATGNRRKRTGPDRTASVRDAPAPSEAAVRVPGTPLHTGLSTSDRRTRVRPQLRTATAAAPAGKPGGQEP